MTYSKKTDHKVANDWQAEGLCRVRDLPVDIFFPSQGEAVDQRAQLACLDCPVNAECLEHALHHEKHGYWAGTSEKQRQRIRKNLKISVRSPQSNYAMGEVELFNPDRLPQTRIKTSTAVCGTASGYSKHLRNKTNPCQACKDAKAEGMREYHKKKRVAS